MLCHDLALRVDRDGRHVREAVARQRADGALDLEQPLRLAFADGHRNKPTPNSEFHEIAIGREQTAVLLSVVAQVFEVQKV